ncbi:nucleotide cyclase [Haematococcus lacustris]
MGRAERGLRILLYSVSLLMELVVVRCASSAGNCTPIADAICLAQLGLTVSGLKIASSPASASQPTISYSALASGILNCVGAGESTLRPLRILSPEQNRYILPPATERWSAMSGIDVIVDYRSIPELPGIILDTSSNGQRLYDGWILDPVVMVDIAQSGMLEPLDAYIAADASIDWPDFIRYFRQVSSVYNGTVTGVPLAGKASTLYYRKDVFAMANLSAPSTWDEFVTIARALNGSDFNADGVPDHSICWQIINCLEDTVVFSQLLTPMTQALGTKSGWLFDPETMDPLVNNEAMLQALSMYKELLGYTLPLPVESQCSLVHVPFLQGACAMTIKWDEQFKGIQLMDQLFSLPANPWHGRIGFAQLPGSTSVLNRATGKLERCTVATCPYATQQRNQFTGQTELINTAPNFGLAGFSGVINALQPSSYKKATFQLFAFLSASNISFPLVIAISPVGPFLNMHTSTEPALLNAWKAAGYFPPDVEHFMQNMNATLANPNVALDIRITSGHLYRQTLSHGLAMLQRGSTAAEVMAWVTAGFAAQLAKDGGPSQVQAAYLAGLNTRLVPRSPAPLQAASPALSTSTSSPDLTVPIAVPTTVCSVVLIVACLAVLVRRSSFAARLFGKSIAPRLGSSVTLLVTDIQDSTTLWETLSQDDMNAAVELHHSLVRKLLVQHHGYESATEGDAFILAFHTPSDALHWAQAFQQGLLHLAWPEQLLHLDAGAPVWAAPGAHAVVGLQKQASLLSSEAALSAGANLPILSIVVEEANRQDSLASASAPIPARTFYANQWMLAPSKTSDHTRLVFRGLRVRVGLHSGVHEGSDALLNKTTGRMQYGGRPLAMAKAVGDVGQGGMVLLSQSAFEQLPVSKLASFGMLLNMGDYVFTKDESLPATPIYQAFGRGLEHRAAFLQGPLRASEQLQAGVLDAPLGDVSITFANLVGVGTLMAWDKTLASAALDLYHTHAISTLQAMPQLLHQLPGHGGQQPALLPAGTTDPGYLVELSGGLCLAAFLSPAAALLWALQLRADLLEAPWQEELLAHELCEEVAVAQAVDVQPELHPLRPRQEEEGATPQPISKAASLRSEGTGPGPCKLLPVTAEVMSVLFRGPRLKVGVDVGRVHADINPMTARMTYRGRVMNRAARIADKAHSGSVWCSQAAWEGCSQACPELVTQLGVKGHSLGQFSLKGVLEPMHLMRMQSDPCKPRFLRGPGSSMAQVATTWHQLHSPQPSPQSCRASRGHAFSVGSCRSATSAAQRGQLGGSITALQLLQAFAVQAGARPASSPYMAELGMGPDLGLMEPKTLVRSSRSSAPPKSQPDPIIAAPPLRQQTAPGYTPLSSQVAFLCSLHQGHDIPATR